jgi:hypothetical protein
MRSGGHDQATPGAGTHHVYGPCGLSRPSGFMIVARSPSWAQVIVVSEPSDLISIGRNGVLGIARANERRFLPLVSVWLDYAAVIRKGSIVLLVAGVWALVTGCGPSDTAAGPTSTASASAPVALSPLATPAVPTPVPTLVAPVRVPHAAPARHATPAHAAPPPAESPPAPAPATPTPVLQGNCVASPRTATPGDGGDETITVHTTAGATVKLLVHYKTTTHPLSGVANNAGTAVITFSIGRPTRGYPVRVDVSTSSGQVCGTQFTPH